MKKRVFIRAVTLISLSLVLVGSVLISNTNTNDKEVQVVEASTTAGITKYMGEVVSKSLDTAEPDESIIENLVTSVSANAEVYKEEAEKEESVEYEYEGDYEEVVDELSSDECLERLFGYVPDQWELDYLYRTVKVECGYNEPDEGVIAAVYVIANRVRSDADNSRAQGFPNTIYGVISQRNQFETWSNGNIQNCNYVEDYFIEIVDDVIAEDPYPQYRDLLYFTCGQYNRYCIPAFSIGHHYFGK